VDAETVLPSWNDGPAKRAVLELIGAVTTPGPDHVPAAERIAAFDNDGTLWCEQPVYAQTDFVVRRFKEMVRDDPDLAARQPYKAAAEDDVAWIQDIYTHEAELLEGLTEAFCGITAEEFEASARAFFATATHPTLGVPYTRTAYKPMRELVELLTAHDFRVFICSTGGRDFMRVISEETYGIPRDRVIGSAPILDYREGHLYRTSAVEQPIADGPGKAVHIWTRTGRLPLLAGGNSDGDMEMLECARLGLLIRHDDAERETAYDTGSERALAAAEARGWTVVSMKRDFATVF
jgi:phosphoserine phosphatase